MTLEVSLKVPLCVYMCVSWGFVDWVDVDGDPTATVIGSQLLPGGPCQFEEFPIIVTSPPTQLIPSYTPLDSTPSPQPGKQVSSHCHHLRAEAFLMLPLSWG